jgi:uncharacterized membrane protein YhaH (DUF805 family)
MEKSVTQWMVEPIRKYATFSGRARRAEYWWFGVFVALVVFGLTMVDMLLIGADAMAEYGAGPLTGLFSLAIIIPSIAVTVRRLHDRDKSGWWLLWGLLPLIGALILFIQYVQRGTVGDNRYGADPISE